MTALINEVDTPHTDNLRPNTRPTPARMTLVWGSMLFFSLLVWVLLFVGLAALLPG